MANSAESALLIKVSGTHIEKKQANTGTDGYKN
jgi:hypothetical protein